MRREAAVFLILMEDFLGYFSIKLLRELTASTVKLILHSTKAHAFKCFPVGSMW
jgi:hypothetical protein